MVLHCWFLQVEDAASAPAVEDQPALRVAAAEGTLASLRGRSAPSDQGGLLTQAIGASGSNWRKGPLLGVELIAGVLVSRTAVAPLRAHGMTLGAMAVAARRAPGLLDPGPLGHLDGGHVGGGGRHEQPLLGPSRQGKEEWKTTFDACCRIALVDGACA